MFLFALIAVVAHGGVEKRFVLGRPPNAARRRQLTVACCAGRAEDERFPTPRGDRPR